MISKCLKYMKKQKSIIFNLLNYTKQHRHVKKTPYLDVFLGLFHPVIPETVVQPQFDEF